MVRPLLGIVFVQEQTMQRNPDSGFWIPDSSLFKVAPNPCRRAGNYLTVDLLECNYLSPWEGCLKENECFSDQHFSLDINNNTFAFSSI